MKLNGIDNVILYQVNILDELRKSRHIDTTELLMIVEKYSLLDYIRDYYEVFNYTGDAGVVKIINDYIDKGNNPYGKVDYEY